MKKTLAPLLALFLLSGCAVQAEQPTAAAETPDNMAHTHIGHVISAWTDTPGGQGLLPTAMAEAEIAAFHAGLAAKQPDNLDWMKLHTTHVMHALAPTTVAKGPGKGYGVLKAARGVEKHIQLAAQSADASQAVKLHAQHVTASAHNTVQRGERMLQLAQQVMSATDVSTAAPLVKRIATLADALTTGMDANGDGTVSWHPGEGGLAQSQTHMGFMTKEEGL